MKNVLNAILWFFVYSLYRRTESYINTEENTIDTTKDIEGVEE